MQQCEIRNGTTTRERWWFVNAEPDKTWWGDFFNLRKNLINQKLTLKEDLPPISLGGIAIIVIIDFCLNCGCKFFLG